ncbi:glycosyltransferase [Candidatus Woesearchaeota archaeon]|nr:glycosyltransferase [Candidatus Woesearchaeota archaeon]
MDLSIIVPAYNEEKNIKKLYEKLKNSLKKTKKSYEIIFIDDGSTDKTFQIIKNISKKEKKVKAISFYKNFGKSAAYMAGFEICSGDIIITMDSDLQDDPSEIPNFIKKIKDYDLVVGWKHERKDPLFKTLPSKIFNMFNSLLFDINLKDNDSGYKAMKKEVIETLNLYGDLYRYIPAIVANYGYTVSEIKVKHHKRKHGKSKYGYLRLITGSLDLLTVKFITHFNQRPLHLFGIAGIFSFIFGFFAELIVLYYRILLKHPFAKHLALLILGVLLILLGVQLVSIGLIGELVISREKKHKSYKIKKTLNFG